MLERGKISRNKHALIRRNYSVSLVMNGSVFCGDTVTRRLYGVADALKAENYPGLDKDEVMAARPYLVVSTHTFYGSFAKAGENSAKTGNTVKYGSEVACRRNDGVLVVPIGCLKN